MGSFLGQNFLKDSKYIIFVIQKIKALGFDTIFEIGPGKGALTKRFVNDFEKIYLFEKDSTFIDNLQDLISDKGQVFAGDFLEADLNKLYLDLDINIEKTVRVGNLPYYITSPIFRKLFEYFDKIKYGIFLIQKEVGEKIKTDATDKSYLWRLLNYRYNIKYLKTVPAKAFSPAPKVQSCYVDFTLTDKKNIDFDKLLILLDNISAYKRKTLSKIWKMNIKKNINNINFILDLKNLDKNKEFNFYLAEELQSKRIQELTREDMEKIIL